MRKISILFITVLTLLVSTASGIGVYAVLDALERHDRGECATWNDEAKMYPKYDRMSDSGYYLLAWQKAQCDYYDIPVTYANGEKVYVKKN